MKLRELKKTLERFDAGYDDFEIEFATTSSQVNDGSYFPIVRIFNNIELCDIGYSAKVISFTGDSK